MNYNDLIKIFKEINIPIFICGHINPDYDCIGSSFALAKLFSYLNKEVFILLDKEDTQLILDKKDSCFVKDKINYKKYVFICVDLNDCERLGKYKDSYQSATIKINIDHHIGNSTKADYILSKNEMSSTCEIIYNLINKINKKILEQSLCEYLYAGIITDTNCLTRRLTNKTLEITQDLINRGARYKYINQLTLWKRSKEELKTLGKLAKKIKTNKYFSYVIVNKKYCKKLSLNSLTKKIAEDLRKMNNVNILVFLVKNKDRKTTGKIMTNTCEIAMNLCELFGGGGHKNEAGFTTYENPKQIIEKLLNYFNKNI